MRLKWYIFIFTCLIGWSLHGLVAADPIHNWRIEGMGTVSAPENLTVVPLTDMIEEFLLYAEKEAEKAEAKNNKKPNPLKKEQAGLTAEKYRAMMKQVRQLVEEHGVQGYQLALKESDSYDIGLAASVRVPAEYADKVAFFQQIAETSTEKQQQVLLREALNTINAYGDGSSDYPAFKMEMLAYDPIKISENRNFKITSLGGSMAFTIFKSITPYSFKAYLIQDAKDYYVLFLNTNPTERKKWNKMLDRMLTGLVHTEVAASASVEKMDSEVIANGHQDD